MSSTDKRRTLYLITFILALMVTFLGVTAAYEKGTVEAQSYTLLNQSSQILTALQSYKEKEGSLPSHLSELLSDGFLIEMPSPQNIAVTPYALLDPEGDIFLAGISQDVCLMTHKLTQEKDFSVRAKCIHPPAPEYKGMLLVFGAR